MNMLLSEIPIVYGGTAVALCCVKTIQLKFINCVMIYSVSQENQTATINNLITNIVITSPVHNVY